MEGDGRLAGTGSIVNFKKQFLPYEEARDIVRSLGLKSFKEWQEYRNGLDWKIFRLTLLNHMEISSKVMAIG